MFGGEFHRGALNCLSCWGTTAERVRVVLRVRPPIRPDESPGSLEILSDGASVKLHRQ